MNGIGAYAVSGYEAGLAAQLSEHEGSYERSEEEPDDIQNNDQSQR